MEQKKYPRRRSIPITFMVDEQERDLIYEKMDESGIKSIRAYMLKQAVEGRIICVEMESVREMVRLLSNATNNINQIARRANMTNSIHAADIEAIRKLTAERKTLFGGYHKLKETSRQLAIAKANAEWLLDIKPNEQNQNAERNYTQHITPGL